jgi:LemA protein
VAVGEEGVGKRVEDRSIVLTLSLAVAAVVLAMLYNSLVRTRLRVKEAWAAVEVQLQRRASLIPNLVEIVKGYASHEHATLAQVVDARGALNAAAGPRAAASANDDLSGALGRLFALAEAYPDLKADTQFDRLHADLADTENKIAYARNYYNGAVEIYNTRVQTIPGLLVAGFLRFQAAEFFRADAAARQAVAARLS